MPLENWYSIGKLQKHTTNQQELNAMFGVVQRCLQDALIKGLSSDQKYIQSYQAAFEISLALLYSKGYRPLKAGHHYIVWQCMKDLLDKKEHDRILLFESAAKKRNKLTYDIAGIASEKEADEMYNEAKIYIDNLKEKIEKF